MRNNNKQYKKSKVLNGVLGGLLALVVAGGVAFVGVLSNGFKNWDNIKPPAQEEPNTPEDDTTKGEASIENGENNKALNKNSAVMPKKAKAIKFATAAETVAHTAPCLMAQ